MQCMVISLLRIPYVHRIYLKIYGSGQPYIYTVNDSISDNFPAKITVYVNIPCM